MPINPRAMPTTPEGRQWQELADLKRRVRTLERSQANSVQHGYAENLSGSSGNSNGAGSPLVVCSVTVNVPTTNHRVLLSPSVTVQASNNTSEITAALTTDDPSFTGVVLPFGGALNTTTALTLSPAAANWAAGGFEFWNHGYFIDLYNYPTSASSAHVPTAGDRTYNLVAYRNAGAATFSVSNARLWVGVL